MMSQCKVLIAFTFALLSQSTLYLRPCADASTRYIRQIPMAYTTVCLSASEHGERIALVNWISGVQWVAPRCSRMASGDFSSLIIRQAPRNSDVSGWLMAGEPTFAVGHVVSPNRRARRKATNREDKTGYTEAQPSQLKSQKKIPSDTVPSDPTPHCSGVRHIRTSGNQASGNIRSYQVGIRNVSFGTEFGGFGSQSPVSLSKPKKYPESRICIGCH
ncbi:unnamed protein product [Penicillium salamii]|uniref:Secreted protein n=1 Tax=Penicillium salamii TaxID=1612424 RepID=A0A9W4IZ51_9EURO|nr:unnamed protein product [Penicillium salamii]CAG8076548.1 unnamed protein product [Penicillium salamii]CAG8082823.1 unnamed protein product [Penicillium salamii]CAG8365652.1 unnamed protein product [Penicillium salamii]CAG8370640.1 unnamed protein product [Penicillium salamii]